jgi:hypothetical protein
MDLEEIVNFVNKYKNKLKNVKRMGTSPHRLTETVDAKNHLNFKLYFTHELTIAWQRGQKMLRY